MLAMARRCLVPVLALLLALSVDARGLRQAAVLAGEPALPGLPKVLQEVSRRAAEALAASEAAAQQQAAVAAGAADPAAQPSSSTPAHNEAANALSPAQREFVEGLTDYLFFELGYSPDEQRLAWSSWTQDDKDLYNDYNGFWLTQTPEEKARFIKLVPYVGFSYAEFLRGLELYLTSRESGDAPEALGLNSELRYAYFKYDLYWGVLSEVEREELRELAGRGSGGEQVSAPDGSLPTDQEEFRRGLAGYLNFLLQPADRQNEIWEGYSLAAKELFYNYQSYWTSLSPASQQAAVQVITGQAPLDSLPARTAQQEFLIGLQQYLIFIGRPADVQVAQLAGFSAEVVAAFTGYRNYWAGLSESERREHLALIRAVVAAEASASASLPATVVDPTVSQEFLLQLHNYLQFQALGSSEQEARWATYSQQEREQFARIQDYWLGTSAEGQALALERVRILLRTIPFPNVVGLSWEQVQFLIRLKEYLDVRSLPPQERVLVTQSWSMAQWEKYNEDDAFWLSLSFDDQQTLVDRLNRAMSGAVVDTPPSAVGYEGTLSIKERQFLKGLRLFLDFSARPIAEQQMQLSGLTAAQLAAYNGYTEYWSALPAEEKEAVLARMEEPGVLSVVSDLSVLAEEVPGSGQADIYQGILSIRERQFLKGLQLYLEFIQLPVSEQEQQLVTLTSTQFRVYENYRSYWQGLSAQAKAEKLLQLSEPGILDVSADLSQTFIIPSGPSTGPVSGEYTGSLSLPERQFLKAVQFYLEFIQRPLPEQQAQTAGLAGIQRQVFENIRNFWQTQTPLQQAQIRAQMSEPGILDVPTVLSPEIMNAIPNRAMEADSPAQQATSRAASVPVASYTGDLSTRERQFLKGLQSYLDFAAQPDMVRSVELQNLSEQQRQVYIGFQSYWSALPEPEKRQLLARMQEPGILNVESDLSLEVGLPGKAVEAMESRAGGTLQAEMRAPSVPTAGASQTGELSLRERQFLKGLQVYLDFIAQPLSEQQQQLIGLTESQRLVFEGLQAYWNSQTVAARATILEQLRQPGVLDVESDLSLMFELSATSNAAASTAARAARSGGAAVAYEGELSVRERQFLKGLQNYLDFDEVPLAEKFTALTSLDAEKRQVYEGFQKYWLALPESEKAQLRARLAVPGILDVESDQALMIQPESGNPADVTTPAPTTVAPTPVPTTTPPPPTASPPNPADALRFPSDIVLPSVGQVAQQVSPAAVVGLPAVRNFAIGLQSYLLLLDGTVPASSASALAPSAVAAINIYDRFWSSLGAEEKTYLRALVRVPEP